MYVYTASIECQGQSFYPLLATHRIKKNSEANLGQFSSGGSPSTVFEERKCVFNR